MSTTLESQQTLTASSIDTALVHINTELARRNLRSDGPVDESTGRAVERAINEARELKSHLEQNPSACTAEALICCNRLLELCGT